MRLREDIRLQPAATVGDRDLYVMFITRREFYTLQTRFLDEQMLPAHEFAVQGGVIAKIYRVSEREDKFELVRLIAEAERLMKLKSLFVDWIGADEANRAKVTGVVLTARRDGRPAAVDELRKHLPMLSEPDATEIVDWALDRL